jgi:hypothetical protein
VTKNAGWVSVGTDHDTAALAAQSIRRWWESMGAKAYPAAAKLFSISRLPQSDWSATNSTENETTPYAHDLIEMFR